MAPPKPNKPPMPPMPPGPARALLRWYGIHARHLPWRAPPGEAPDPYRVWLSEVMLQQTRVAAVLPYFEAFVRRWPTVRHLAAASLKDVLAAWAGLGYYARARNLHACARAVVAGRGGAFPATVTELRVLPGVGPYTAAAVAAIAFGLREAAVDGNAERVLARYYGVGAPLPAARPQLRALAAGLVPARRPGDFAQALMDLGATVCTPAAPSCGSCPLRRGCIARASGEPESLPRRAPKRPRPVRYGVAFLAVRAADGAVLLRRRPPSGLLGGMPGLHGTPWRDKPWNRPGARAHAPARGRWRRLGAVTHVFTHFRLELEVWTATPARLRRHSGDEWISRADLAAAGLPTLIAKAVALGDATAEEVAV